MRAVSLRGVDEKLAAALKKAAENENKSVNQWMLEALRERLGLAKDQRFTKTYDDLDSIRTLDRKGIRTHRSKDPIRKCDR